MKKKLSEHEILINAIWKEWRSMVEQKDIQKYANISWMDIAHQAILHYANGEHEVSYIESALESFKFEKQYMLHQPDSTLKYMWGEHAMLYDTLGCAKHKILMTIHWDCELSVSGLRMFCPECNKDKFLGASHMDEYIKITDAEYLDDEQWATALRTAKWHQAYERKQNIKYRINKWFEKGYFKYRIKRALGFYNKKKEK